jgi:L-ribulose-5-phosphate 3-epimerase
MNNLFGVMQGRLLPKYHGRYQAHPVGYWQDEFFLASKQGLDCVEFILDFDGAAMNPLLSENGVDEILSVVDRSGIEVKTVCADYFMEAPLHSEDKTVALRSYGVLQRLISRSSMVGVNTIVIPCVDHASLDSLTKIEGFVRAVTPAIDELENNQITLSIEADLAPGPFVDLLERFDSKTISVNYDTGNSAALGYDPLEELAAYGDRITDIHIKDRKLGGGPVLLGTGDTEFDVFFKKLREFDYSGPFIMQAYRDDEGVEVFKQQLAWIKNKMDRVYAC